MTEQSKSELRAQMAHELGSSFDDTLEALPDIVLGHKRAAAALMGAIPDVESICLSVQQDIDDGVFNLEQGKRVIMHLARAVNGLREKAAASTRDQLRGEGRIQALTGVVAATRKVFEVERSKATAPHRAAVDGGRPPGIKAQRQAEDVEKKKKKKTATKKKSTRRT